MNIIFKSTIDIMIKLLFILTAVATVYSFFVLVWHLLSPEAGHFLSNAQLCFIKTWDFGVICGIALIAYLERNL
jgi:hypothetical protein